MGKPIPQKVLFIDPASGYYRLKRYTIGDYFGPVDLGIHLTSNYRSLNIGVGLFAGSILPGSNRLVVSGFSPCWRGFYVSSMGGAGLVFDNLGINMISLTGHSPVPVVLYVNRNHGEEVEVEVHPVDLHEIWHQGRSGVYSMIDWVYDRHGARYENDPRVLAVGPAAEASDFGAIVSVPIAKKKLSFVDTWAGRGGLGSAMLQHHGVAAIIYGGMVADEDFRDRTVADKWFEQKYQQKLVMKDFEATTKYRYDPKVQTGGTFGVNYATMGGKIMAFNYRTIYWTEEERKNLHQKLIVDHYLKQFNEETIEKKQQATCGEPCSAVCKKMNAHFKKDYEPYQTMGPLCGIFDQRAAEKLNHACDTAGFDGISMGGVLAWLMECLDRGFLTPEDLGVTRKPRWNFDRSELVLDHGPDSDVKSGKDLHSIVEGFDVVADSMHNAELGLELLESILHGRGILDLSTGVRKWGRRIRKERGIKILDYLVYNAHGRKGWMVPNQYWTPGALAPMAIMGKYYMHYGNEFMSPRELGRKCAERLKKELILDNMGVCRFHRGWAEEMLPDIFESLYGLKEAFLNSTSICASRINSRNASVLWESERNIDFVHTFLKRKRDIEKDASPVLAEWIAKFDADKREAALGFWFEILKGIAESLRDFN